MQSLGRTLGYTLAGAVAVCMAATPAVYDDVIAVLKSGDQSVVREVDFPIGGRLEWM